MLFKSNIRRDGSCPVCLRVAKEDKTKYIDLQLSATKGQWDELASRFKKDKRVNPNYENYNALLNRYEVRKDEILQKFMEERVNWTLNQFEEEFLGMSKQGKVYDYFMRQVENLKGFRLPLIAVGTLPPDFRFHLGGSRAMLPRNIGLLLGLCLYFRTTVRRFFFLLENDAAAPYYIFNVHHASVI